VHHNASIKEIDFIRIGKSAGGSAGTIEPVVAAAADGSTGTFGGSGRPEPDNSRPVTAGSNRPDGARLVIDPAEGRYVDKNYDPLPAETLRSAAESEDPESFYLRVAKRIPVRMRLKVDQRAINRLLIECANSKLTVEVRQIRMNRPSDEAAYSGDEMIRGGSESMSRPMGGFESSTILDLSGMDGNQRDFSFGEGETRTADNPFPYDVYLEIYGIVYIYNPVDTSILGGEDNQSEPEDDEFVAAVGSRPRGASGP
jgi:hypothetical protein